MCSACSVGVICSVCSVGVVCSECGECSACSRCETIRDFLVVIRFWSLTPYNIQCKYSMDEFMR